MNSKKIMGLIISVMLISNTTAFATSKTQVKERRIYGKDRYETSVQISKEGWKTSSYAVICRGDNFADALCSVPLAKKYNAPILLMSKGKVNAELKNELKRLNVSNVFIAGGEGVINKTVEREIKSISNIKMVDRIGGRDRYETSQNIANKLGNSGEVFVTTGESSADALSISTIAANRNTPILLTSKDRSSIQNYLKGKNINKTFIIGGETCVSREIEKILPNTQRIYGKDRFETNERIIEKFSDALNFKTVYIALGKSERGDEFADALSSAALAARENNPIVLVYKDIHKGTESLIKSKMPKEGTVIVLGGEKIIPENIVTKLTNIEQPSNEKPKDIVPPSNTNKPIGPNKPIDSKPTNPVEEKIQYTVLKELSFPGAFTYDIRVNGKSGEKLTGYQLIYDGKVIAEDKDKDGVVRPLTIFFEKDADKSKFKVIKDGKEINFNGLNK